MNCPTTNRKNGHPHDVRLEIGKKDRLGSALDPRNQGTKQLQKANGWYHSPNEPNKMVFE